jgi:hypothetical protein
LKAVHLMIPGVQFLEEEKLIHWFLDSVVHRFNPSFIYSFSQSVSPAVSQ